MLRTCYGEGVYYKSFFKQSDKDIFFLYLKIIEFWVFYDIRDYVLWHKRRKNK